MNRQLGWIVFVALIAITLTGCAVLALMIHERRRKADACPDTLRSRRNRADAEAAADADYRIQRLLTSGMAATCSHRQGCFLLCQQDCPLYSEKLPAQLEEANADA